MNKKNIEDKNSNSLEQSKPFTVWDELAQVDVLVDYMNKYEDSNINKSPELKSTVLESIYSYSTEQSAEVEIYYGKKCYLQLKKFLDKTKKCRQQLAKQ